VSALQLGVADEALRRAVAYIGERQQFGRALATFQALSQKVADCYIDIEALRSTLWQLCWRLDAGLDARAAAAVAKSWAADCGHRVSHAAQHMHGGIGVDVSYPIHRFTLWSRALELSLGGAAAQLDALGRQLAANAFGE
jgi:alkylation response protein AidB-like acyl-CoA dehydrogenase